MRMGLEMESWVGTANVAANGAGHGAEHRVGHGTETEHGAFNAIMIRVNICMPITNPNLQSHSHVHPQPNAQPDV